MSRNNFKIYSRNSNNDKRHYNNIQLSNSSNQLSHSNRIYGQTSYDSCKDTELSHLSNLETNTPSSQNLQQPQHHY
ncbi:unnamed protein product, partial [Rotaria sordida]